MPLSFIDIIIILLELSGIGITTYIISKGFVKKSPVCFISYSCDTVLQSKYSSFLGVRIVVIGFIYYLSMLVLFLLKFQFIEYEEILATLFSTLVTLAAIVSVILTYIQTRVLKSLCSWCLLSAFTNLCLFFVMLYYTNIT